MVVPAWSRGGKVNAAHHLDCFTRSLRVEVCASNRGKCKSSGAKFVKGTLRFGFATTGTDEIAWLCLESAAALLPPVLACAGCWTPCRLAGYEQLSDDLRAQAERVFSSASPSAHLRPAS